MMWRSASAWRPVTEPSGEHPARVACAHYDLQPGSCLRRSGWLITAENAVDGAELANRLFAAHIDYLALPETQGTGWLVPVRDPLQRESARQLIESALLPATERRPDVIA